MPICTLETNLCKEKIPRDLHIKLANALATTLKKDLERISVTISPDLMMTRGGSTDPTATLHIWSIAVFKESSQLDQYEEKLFAFFKKEWPDMCENRLVLLFHDIDKPMVRTK